MLAESAQTSGEGQLPRYIWRIGCVSFRAVFNANDHYDDPIVEGDVAYDQAALTRIDARREWRGKIARDLAQDQKRLCEDQAAVSLTPRQGKS
jgi:hypothetical protein